MPNIAKLKSDVKKKAEDRGHILSRYFTPDGKGTRATATCIQCGAGVTVDVYPVKAFGEAIEEDCQDCQEAQRKVDAIEGDK